jgi:TonB-linked SusC/RagA family outer membrane protein
MKGLTLLFMCFLISMGLAIAQNKRVTGTVVDETGELVIGASVVVKGNTSIGTVTDLDGRFILDVPASAEALIVRYLGKQDQEVAVAPSVIVTLQPSDTSLDEVIVVAYGTAKKSSFTGSASTIKGEKLEKIQSSNLSKSLEGTVAGLQTTSGSGQPGDDASIIIRGLGSISASRKPLIILDGIPYEGSLNSISSYDIEAFTVLKDAAANSLYGARGSNGVIIITTKKGKSGKATVNFDARAGFNTRGIPTYDVITDPGEYYEMYWESLRNKNLAGGASYLQANAAASAGLIGNLKYNVFNGVPNAELVNPVTGKLNPNATTRKWNDNWITDPFRDGLRQEYNVNVSQGTENSNLYASVSYLDDNGYVVNSDFKRITALLKGEQKVGEYFKIKGAIGYTNAATDNLGSLSSNYRNIFMFGQQIAPIFPIYLYDQATGEPLLDGSGNKRYDFGTEYARPYASEQNPMATIEADINKLVVDNITARGSFEAKFLKDFTFTLNAAYDVFNTVNTVFATPIGGDAANVGGRGQKETERYSAVNINQILNYKKSFDNHNLDVLLVHETKSDNVTYMYGHMTNFVDPANPEFSNAARYQDLTSSEESYSLEGYVGKVDYNFNDKYYLTASLRRDGSSRFHKDNRWGNFWAAGASWRLSKEEFLSDVDFINELKLKASYGTQGNDNIGDALDRRWYAYRNLYSVSRIDGEPSVILSSRGNPDLTWEKSANFNAGIELDAWENRVMLNADFFVKDTKDLLYAKPLAVSEGLPATIFVNDIDMRNTGFEVELGVDIIKTNDLRWNVNLNATHYKNKLTRLPADKAGLIASDGGYQADSYWRKIGGSIYDYYTYESAGVDKESGKALYNVYDKIRDENGVLTGFEKKDPTTSTSNATLMETGKSPIPDLYGGIGSTLEFIGIDVSIQTAYQLGGYIMDDVYQVLMNAGENGTNFHKDMFQRWTPENRETTVPLLLYENRDQNDVSDRWLTSASYFSIRNVTLGYTFPKKWLRSVKIEKLRVYGVADNLWYISHRKGLDVRQSFTGDVDYVYSPLRAISLGVQLSF